MMMMMATRPARPTSAPRLTSRRDDAAMDAAIVEQLSEARGVVAEARTMDRTALAAHRRAANTRAEVAAHGRAARAAAEAAAAAAFRTRMMSLFISYASDDRSMSAIA